jgi:Tetratricopeptide repeat
MIATLALALVLAQDYYTPDEARQLFAEGTEAYEREQYERAIEAWTRLVDRGLGGPDVLYNLGTAYLRKGDLGHAVLYLERARRALPGSEDVRANLEVARARQLDRVVGGNDEPFLQRLATALPADVVSWIFLGAWAAAFAALILSRRVASGRRTVLALAAGTLLLLAVPAGILVAIQAYVARTIREAVVMTPTLQARELPAPHARVAFEVHAGLKVRVLDAEGHFVRIRLPNGLVGWAEQEGIAEI